MLGLQYVVNKSKSLTTKLDISGRASSQNTSDQMHQPEAASQVPHTTFSGNEGKEFLAGQAALYQRVLSRHTKLINSGERLSEELGKTRKKLMDQVKSEQYLIQHFDNVKQVRKQISHIRILIQKIADEIEDVENIVTQKTEEYMAAQNASFSARQQQELEHFENKILTAKEIRRKELLEERRQVLTQAFENDLKTYQTLVSYQGAHAASRAIQSNVMETLESVDLIVSTDEKDLSNFYDTDSAASSESIVSSPHDIDQAQRIESECEEVENEEKT